MERASPLFTASPRSLPAPTFARFLAGATPPAPEAHHPTEATPRAPTGRQGRGRGCRRRPCAGRPRRQAPTAAEEEGRRGGRRRRWLSLLARAGGETGSEAFFSFLCLFPARETAIETSSSTAPETIPRGPTRAIVMIDPVNYEVELKVKGDTPSEDKLLSLLLIEDKYYPPTERCQGVHCHTYSSKLSTVEVTVGHLSRTVEATIVFQVVEGSWPIQYHGRFVAHMASLDDLEMELVDSRGGTVTTSSDGAIELSRCVVPVEVDGELKLWVDAWHGDDRGIVVGKDQVTFAPGRAGRSVDTCDVGFCKMRVTVAWSLLVNW